MIDQLVKDTDTKPMRKKSFTPSPGETAQFHIFGNKELPPEVPWLTIPRIIERKCRFPTSGPILSIKSRLPMSKQI